jgi:hypothetical protein
MEHLSYHKTTMKDPDKCSNCGRKWKPGDKGWAEHITQLNSIDPERGRFLEKLLCPDCLGPDERAAIEAGQ